MKFKHFFAFVIYKKNEKFNFYKNLIAIYSTLSQIKHLIFKSKQSFLYFFFYFLNFIIYYF